MGVEGFKFAVKSSWWPDSYNQLSDVISLGSTSDPTQWSEEFEGEIHHEIVQENLLHLSVPSKDAEEILEETPCTITIYIEEPCWRISKLSVVSQTRIVEIYGPLGEYVCTSKGNSISDDPNSCLYNSQPDVSVRNELTLKFPGAKNHLWVYGVKLLVEKTDALPAAGNVDYLHVDEMLKSSKLPITDKAEQAKQFLQKYSSMLGASQKQPGAPDPKAIFRILESEYKSHMKPVEDVGRNVSQYIANFIQAKQNPAKNEEGASSASSLGEVKAYVDHSMKQLEERVQHNLKIQLEAMEEKQNKKLDAILQLLAQKN